MITTPTEPADAPMPPVGTEQAAEDQAKKKEAPEESGGSEIVSDAVEAVADIVVNIVTGIFD